MYVGACLAAYDKIEEINARKFLLINPAVTFVRFK